MISGTETPNIGVEEIISPDQGDPPHWSEIADVLDSSDLPEVVKLRNQVDKRLYLLHKLFKKFGRYGDDQFIKNRPSLRLSIEGQADFYADQNHRDRVLKQQISYLNLVKLRLVSVLTIDQNPKWFGHIKKWFRTNSLKKLYADLRLPFPRPVDTGFEDHLKLVAMKKRQRDLLERCLVEVNRASLNGWFVVMDTLTVADWRSKAFESDPTAVRDYIRRIGRDVLEQLGRKRSESFHDVLKYVCVPEFGTKTGRFHYHVLLFLKALPVGASVDPNMKKPVPCHREISALKKHWKYGFSTPIAVRYRGDAFTQIGWQWPVDKKGDPIARNDAKAVAFYLTDYVKKEIGASKCPKTKIYRRIKMSRNFGLLDLQGLSNRALVEAAKMNFHLTSSSSVLRKSASRQLRQRLTNERGITLRQFLEARKPRMTLLQRLRILTGQMPICNNSNFAEFRPPPLKSSDISNELLTYLARFKLTTHDTDAELNRRGIVIP